MYCYFVSYAHTEGFANCIVNRDEPWDHLTHTEIMEDISEKVDHLGIIVMYFKLIYGPEEKPAG